MNNIIVGTAGHVDHGKTCLIKALTGADTDRLKEEKQRGITIELGFADLHAPDGTTIGIIDVPGHERFIKNMLAGIGGIDLVLLVVAADEGVMPQTIEHLDILKLLNIKKGIIVLTKSDTVEREWLDMVKADVLEVVSDSFLEGAPVLEVSSYTGQNIDQLRDLIFSMVADCKEKNSSPELLRIPIDRVFTIDGFGTVITGTLTEGRIDVSQEVMLYPQEKTAKVRNLQVHGHMVQTAYAGQRTAVNLVNIKKEEIEKGNVLAAKNTMKPSMMVDVKIEMLSDTTRELLSGSRIHFYYGADECLCKAVLLDQEKLCQKETGYAQLRLSRDIAVKQGDHFVIRFYSPLETMGGGIVLDANPQKHKRFDEGVVLALSVKEHGAPLAVLEQSIKDGSRTLQSIENTALKMGKTKVEIQSLLSELIESGRCVMLTPLIPVHAEHLHMVEGILRKLLTDYHSAKPLSTGMAREEFRTKLLAKLWRTEAKEAEYYLQYFLKTGILCEGPNTVALNDFKITYTKEQEKLRAELSERYQSKGFEAPELSEIMEGYRNKNGVQQMILALVSEGILVRLSGQTYLHKEAEKKAKELILGQIEKTGSITLAQCRDLLQTSRKYALLFLDYTDEKKWTVKVGDERVLQGGKNGL